MFREGHIHHVDAPKNSEKQIIVERAEILPEELEKIAFQRCVEKEKDGLRFKYGEVAREHPVQEYLETIAKRIPEKPNFPLKLNFLPNWRSVNACALPDGNVYISRELILNCISEEALLGIIAHEYLHIYQEHAKGKKVKSFDDLLARIGQHRVHEYEADIRGVLEHLRETDINPIGYKKLLGSLYHRETVKDVTHGSARDRELNFVDAMYLFHFPATANDLHQLPNEIIDASKDEIYEGAYAIITDPNSVGQKLTPEQKKYRLEQREKAMEKVELNDIPALYKAMRYEDKMVNNKLVRRFTQEHPVIMNAPESDRAKLVNTLIWLFWNEKLMRESLETTEYIVDTYIVPNADLLPKYRNQDRSKLYDVVEKNGNWLEKQVDEVRSEAAICSRITAKMSKQFDFSPVTEEESYKEISERFLRHGGVNISVSREMSVYERELQKKAENYILDRKANDAMFEEIVNEYSKIAQETSLQEVLKMVDELYRRAGDEYLRRTKKRDDDVATMNFERWRVRVQEIAIGVVRKQEFYKKLKKIEKKLVDCSYYKYEGSPLFSDDSDEGAFLTTYVAQLEKNDKEVLGLVKTTDDVELAYSYLVSAKSYTKVFGEISDMRRKNGEALFVDIAINYLNRFPLIRVTEIIKDLQARNVDMQRILSEYSREAAPLVVKLIEAIKDDDLKGYSLETLLECSQWVSDPFLRAQLQRRWWKQYQGEMQFTGKLDALFPVAGKMGIEDTGERESFLEHDVKTKEHFEDLKKRLKESAQEVLGEEQSGRGVAVLLDIDLKKRSEQNKTELLQALLQSRHDDKALRKCMYEESGLAHQIASSFDNDWFRRMSAVVGDDPEEEVLDKEKYRRIDHALQVDRFLKNIYLSNDQSKHLLLRKLLASRGGVLTTAEGRRVFLTMLFRDMVRPEAGQEDVQNTLNKISEALAVEEQSETLYAALQFSLREKIARPPTKANSTLDLYEFQQDAGLGSRDVEKIKFGTFWKKVPTGARKHPEQYCTEYNTLASSAMYELLREDSGQQLELKQTPLQFVKETAGKMSAMGVRLLQNMHLVTEIPKHYAQEFSEVFDGVKGQSKLAALDILEYQWPEMWDELEEVGDRIGGGSIVTVYKAKSKDGEFEVLKVLNPNIKMHLEEMYQYGCKVMDRLASKYGGGYRAARVLLDDIKAWIEHDIDFGNFLKNDAEFKKNHHGFQPVNFDYRLYVPQSKGTANKFFSREEWVEGKNLTKWDELERDGHDMKQIVSLLVQSYVEQVQTRMVLSDIHPGNFAVTKDKRLAVFDRNYYLQLSAEELSLINSCINPLVDEEERKIMFWEYVIGGGLKGSEKAKKISDNFISALSRQNWRDAHRSLIELKQEGVHVPLNFTLLLKNFNNLHLMAVKAGFSDGIFEAMFYSPAN